MEEKTMFEKLKEKLKNRYTDLVNDFDNATREDVLKVKNDIYSFVLAKHRYPNPSSNDETEVLLAYKFLILKRMKDRVDKKGENSQVKVDKFNLSNFFADLDYVISVKGNDNQNRNSNYSSEEFKILQAIERYKSYIKGKNIDNLKTSFIEFLKDIDLDKLQISGYVKKNFKYPSKNSKDLEERLLAYKCEFLQLIKQQVLEKRRTSATFVVDEFSLIDFFAELDYVISNRKSKNSDDKNLDKDESLAEDGKSLLANNYLEAKKEIIKKIITLYSEIEKMEKDISDKKEEIKELREQYKQNEEKMSVLIDSLNAEDDIKKIL